MAETYSIDSGLTACTAATAKTLAEWVSGASTGKIRLIELTVSSDYTTIATPSSIKVELTTFGATGTGTAYTPKKINGEAQNGAAQATAKINDTVEPASQTVVQTLAFIAPGGPFVMQWPLGREGGYVAGTSAFMGVRITSSASINVGVHVKIEE